MKLQRYLRHIKKGTALTIATALLMLMTTSTTRAEVFLTKFVSPELAGGSVTVDTDGNIYVSDFNNPRILKFDSAGNFISQIEMAASSFAVDSQKNIYVPDGGERLVRKFNSLGVLQLQIEPTCSVGSGNCQDLDGPGPRPPVYGPAGVAVDRFDNVYVIGTFHLQKFSSNGNLLFEFPLGGIIPTCITIDNLGNIIIFEKDNGSINKYDPSGNLLLSLWQPRCDLASGFGCVDPDGAGPLELGDGQFGSGGPRALAVDALGNIYASDGNGRIQKFSSTGQFLLKFGSFGDGDGQFGGGSFIAIDSSNRIYVTDGGDRVQVFGQGDFRSVDSATGAGVVTLSTNSGAFSEVTSVAEASLPTTGKPTGVTFPFGFFSWTVAGLAPGQTITMTMNHPSSIPIGAQYWKVLDGAWTNVTSLLGSDDGDNVITLSITDGGSGDADGLVNGRILDPGGIAFSGVQPDSDAPVLTLSADITAEATSASGAVVIYSASATDAVDGPVAVSCSKASGSTFPLGSTNVQCTAQDESGNVANGSLIVQVVDTTPPVVIAPAALSAPSDTNCQAAIPNVLPRVTASDLVGSVSLQQSPAAGTSVGVGSHTITITATDAAGNSHAATTGFTVNGSPTFSVSVNPSTARRGSVVSLRTTYRNCAGSRQSLILKVRLTRPSRQDLMATLPITLQPGQTGSLNIPIRIPSSTPTGLYSLALDVYVGGIHIGTSTAQLTVIP